MRAISLLLRPLLPALLAAGLLAAGCGSVTDTGESSPSRPTPGPVPEDLFLLNAASDPLDTAVSELRVICSGDYDDAAEAGNVFCLVRDQDANDLLGFNKYNFAVVVDPARAAKAVDPRSDSVTLTRVVGVDRKIVALVIDRSGSMAGTKLQSAKNAAKTFVDGLDTAAGDLAAVVAFSDDAQVVQGLTGDKARLRAAIDALAAGGATNLGGAVIEAVRAVGARPGRRGAILLTDGDDTVDTAYPDPPEADPLSPFGYTGSWVEADDSIRWRGVELAMEIDLPVYTIGFQLPDGAAALIDLEIFARATGAAGGPGEQPFRPANEAELTAAFATIQAALDARTPLDTYLYAFPYPKPTRPFTLLKPKAALVVPVRAGVMYLNGNGLLRQKFGTSFRVTF